MSLSDLAPVHLDELNAAAEFMSRVDRKYPLHQRAAEAILDCLPTGTRVLNIGGRTEFGYTSVYFDTTARDSYLLAARGRPHRFKVRVRHYRDSGEAFLEVKTRRGRNTVKERIPHDPSALFEIAPEQYGFISGRLATGGSAASARSGWDRAWKPVTCAPRCSPPMAGPGSPWTGNSSGRRTATAYGLPGWRSSRPRRGRLPVPRTGPSGTTATAHNGSPNTPLVSPPCTPNCPRTAGAGS